MDKYIKVPDRCVWMQKSMPNFDGVYEFGGNKYKLHKALTNERFTILVLCL